MRENTLDNPKTYIFVFSGTILLLVFVLWLTSSEKNQTVTTTVISNTLTQSLDGQRRYLTIDLPEQGQAPISVPVTVNCPVGSTVTFNQTTGSLFEQPLTFLKCE
ncbi:conserved hypothetical protein [Vibrio jasicida]|nr:conserved hypothetical protein [Vibrio jasicida]CAH1604674.1 conserved hypothetical protein [Vibrio jasicida]